MLLPLENSHEASPQSEKKKYIVMKQEHNGMKQDHMITTQSTQLCHK